jgi:hypothetical protein
MINDREMIMASLTAYVDGFTGGDPEKLDTVLHPEFRTGGRFQGAEVWLTREDALASARRQAGNPVAAWSLEALEVRGKIAVARIRSPWEGREFRETITLLQSGEGWRIVFKAFDAD